MKYVNLKRTYSCSIKQCIHLDLSLNKKEIDIWNLVLVVATTFVPMEDDILILAGTTLTSMDNSTHHFDHHLTIWIAVLKGDHAMFVEAHIIGLTTMRLSSYTIDFKILKSTLVLMHPTRDRSLQQIWLRLKRRKTPTTMLL